MFTRRQFTALLGLLATLCTLCDQIYALDTNPDIASLSLEQIDCTSYETEDCTSHEGCEICQLDLSLFKIQFCLDDESAGKLPPRKLLASTTFLVVPLPNPNKHGSKNKFFLDLAPYRDLLM